MAAAISGKEDDSQNYAYDKKWCNKTKELVMKIQVHTLAEPDIDNTKPIRAELS